MRIDGFLSKLNQSINKLTKNSLLQDELKALSYIAVDSRESVSVELLDAFIEVLFKHQEDDSEEAHQLLLYLLNCKAKLPLLSRLQPDYISSHHDWDLPLFIDAMLFYKAEDRIDALVNFSQHQLANVLLNGADFRTTIRNNEHYIGSEERARSVLMAFGYYYYEMLRNRTDEHKHFTGSWTGYSKSIKQKGIDIILKVLEFGKPLNKFAEDVEMELRKLPTKTYHLVKGALNQGELGAVNEMAIFASNEKNRQLVEKSWFGFALT